MIQAIRADIAGELEAIFGYDTHVQATDDSLAKKVLADIRDEKKAHVGELMTLLRHLNPAEAEGEAEVREMLMQLNIIPSTPSGTSNSTIGSLIE